MREISARTRISMMERLITSLAALGALRGLFKPPLTIFRSNCGHLALILAFVTGTAFAHHSFGMFDMQQSITIEGTVKDFQWTNPHVWIDVVVMDPAKGAPVVWGVETDSVNILKNRGWTRASLKAGDKVTMVLHPLKTGSVGGALVTVSVNGQQIGTSPRH